MKRYDLVVIGGGIVGLSTARAYLMRYPHLQVAVLEKEATIGQHQTGHNSGVLHAGIYYKPNSFKAKACVEGQRAMMAYCDEKGIAYRKVGKLIVALDTSELPRLMELWERGNANGVRDLQLLEQDQLREMEPHLNGIKAIYSPHTGIVDYRVVAQHYAHDIETLGGTLLTHCAVQEIATQAHSTLLTTSLGEIETRLLVTCAGVYSDRVRALSGMADEVKIVPFRGSYYKLPSTKSHQVTRLIYPVPDPNFPFLGVHFTPTMAGEVLVGPNAVLALAREGYSRWQINRNDLLETLTYKGFWRLALQYWRMGTLEMFRDLVKPAYLADIQRYMPSLELADLLPAWSGIRAQAMNIHGALLDDFLVMYGERVAHVQNAPSPAATSSLYLGNLIVDETAKAFGLGVVS